MAISITQTGQTETQVYLLIEGLDPDYPEKEFDVRLNGGSRQTYSSYGYSSRTTIIISDLTEGTSYTCQLTAWYNDGGTWKPDPASRENIDQITIYTQGGGGPTNGFYEVAVDTSSVTITVENLYNFDRISYEVYNDSSSASMATQYQTNSQTRHVFDLPTGYYYLEVWYRLDGTWAQLPDNYGSTSRYEIYIQGSTPSIDAYFICSSTFDKISVDLHYTGTFYSAIYKLLNSTGQSTIETIMDSSLDHITFSTTLDPDTEYCVNVYFQPNSSTGSWISDQDDHENSYIKTAGYDYQVIDNIVTMTVDDRYGKYLRYLVRTNYYGGGSQETVIYDSWQNLGRLEDVLQKVVELSYSTPYAINVGFSENRYSGSVTWIKTVYFTTDAGHGQGKVYIYDGSRWRAAIPYIYDGSHWRIAQAYVYDGSRWRRTTAE